MGKKVQTLVKFGEKLKVARKEIDLSQEELAEKAGLHRTYIGMIERGEKNVTLINILKISHALNIPAGKLLEGIK
jgi:transcriptional regulator with XRE-family HTH domain